MKPSDAGVLLLSNCALLGGVLAEALPPDSIPLQCATICGPMVELSAICSGGRGKEKSLLGKRRNIINEKRNVAPDPKAKTIRRPADKGDLTERDFTVLVPAPTSFPSSLLVQQGTVDPPRESKITHTRPTQIFPTQILPTQIFPTEILPTQQQPPPPPPLPPPASSTSPPPAAAPAPTHQQSSTNKPTQSSDDDDDDPTTESTQSSATTTTTTSHSPQSTMGAMTDGGGNAHSNTDAKPDKDQSRWTMNNGERDCVCDNKSFNVPSVAALCSSCIATAEDLQNDMDVIMTTCRFASEQYSPDKDKVVNNIQVQATPPKAVWGQNAGVASGGAATPRPVRGVQIGVGAALSLFQRWFL